MGTMVLGLVCLPVDTCTSFTLLLLVSNTAEELQPLKPLKPLKSLNAACPVQCTKDANT